MNRKILFAVSIIAACTAAQAEAPRQLQKLITKAQAEYCGFDYSDSKVFQDNGKTYVYYTTGGYRIDNDCSSGSGTGAAHLAELVQSKGQWKVVSADVLEVVNQPDYVINERFITSKNMSIRNGIWTFTNAEFGTDPKTGESDPNCCASDLYSNQIRLSDRKLIKRRFIGRGDLPY